MLRASRASDREKNPGAVDHAVLLPVSDADFTEASNRALKSAVFLAAWCGKVDPDSLLGMYTSASAASLELDSDCALHPWEQDTDPALLEESKKDAKECQSVLQDVKEMTQDACQEVAAEATAGEQDLEQEADAEIPKKARDPEARVFQSWASTK